MIVREADTPAGQSRALRRFPLRGAMLAASLTLLGAGALAQETGVTDHDQFLKWVQTAVPEHPHIPGRAFPRRKSAVRAAAMFRMETAEANKSVRNLASELLGAMAYATGVGQTTQGETRNLVLIVGEGLVEGGKLTENFFSRLKGGRDLEGALRESSGWSECYTHVLLSDPDTIGFSLSIMDENLSPTEKRRCIFSMVVRSFGLRIDPAYEREIDDFFPRYLALAIAYGRCSGLERYEVRIRCIMDEFKVQN